MRHFACYTIAVFVYLSLAAAAYAQDRALRIEPHTFTASSGEKVEAELGRLSVPENRRKPNSRTIEIAFVRFKSTAERPGPPVVYLAGGPGGSGIAAARGSRFPLFMAMREIGDIIALDQRGVGLSKPNLGCPGRFSLSLDQEITREVAVSTFKKAASDCARHWRQQGVDLTGYNTNENADDVDDLRRALGVDKVSLWGISYGTHLSLAIIRRHGRNIDRAILAGVEGLDHTYKLPSNVQKHLAELARLVKADPVIGREIPDLLGLMKTVLDRVEREPVVVEVNRPGSAAPVKVTINRFMLQDLTAGTFGNGGESALPSVYYAALKGDFSRIAARVVANLSRPLGVGSAMTHMMDCASGASTERRRRIAREARETLLGDIMDFPLLDACEAWDATDLGDSFRSRVRSEVPVLFISGTLDVRTPVSNAEEVRVGFSKSSHLIIEGATHSDPLFLSSPKIKDVMLEFMRGQPLSTTKIELPPLRFMPLADPNR